MADITAITGLIVLWATRMVMTWGAWGDLSIDGGHEMYVPAMLARGKMLYRDVWYHYSPLAPYFNSVLFRLFGARLEVLYWAGSLSALGTAVVLFVIGRQLSSRLIGYTAGAIVIMQAFHPWLFSFPLPYSFASVYGLLTACIFLWLILRASRSPTRLWTFAAGLTAAVALLLKLEYGAACYSTLGLLVLILAIRDHSFHTLVKHLLAILPGVAICAAVVYWMISIRGMDFITQENIQSWPTSYFMKTFGKAWLEHTGFTISLRAFLDAALRSVPVIVALYVGYGAMWRPASARHSKLLQACAALALGLYQIVNGAGGKPFLIAMESSLSLFFFPQDMVLYVMVAAGTAWFYYFRDITLIPFRRIEIPLLLSFSSILAFRMLMKMTPEGYAIYYNGPVVLSFLLLLAFFIPRRSHYFVIAAEVTICLACLTPVTLHAISFDARAESFVPLQTDRGTIKVRPQVARNYQAAIQFILNADARGESVLAVAEDTSLYFLAGVECPTRVYMFIPGVVAPGQMTKELLNEIDRKSVRYLLWSNRIYPEYGTPVFGKDFAQEIGGYFTSHYRPVNRLVAEDNNMNDLSFTVWERLPAGKSIH